jgi:hypothetical protein
MGLFDFLKKDKPHYDPNNITVKDLEVGFVFEYDLRTWRVDQSASYDWGKGLFSREYKITDGKEWFFLSVDDEEEIFLTLTNKVMIRKVKEDLPDYIELNEAPPSRLSLDGVDYLLGEESPGYFKSGHPDEKGDWEEMISWDYFNESEEKYLNIEQWSEREFEAYIGVVIKPFEISNILPND